MLPIAIFIPKNGWDIGGLNFRFLSQNELLHPAKQEKKDISKIVAKVDTTSIEIDPLLKHQNGSDGSMGAPSGGQLSTDAETELVMTDAGRANLHKFFEKLQNVEIGRAHV